MKSSIIIIVVISIIISIGMLVILTPIENKKSNIDENIYSLPETYSGMQKQLEDVNHAIEQIEKSNPELKQIDDFTLCYYNSDKKSQFYLERYSNDQEYKEWFDNKFPDIDIKQALDNIKDRKQFYEKLGKICKN